MTTLITVDSLPVKSQVLGCNYENWPCLRHTRSSKARIDLFQNRARF